MKSLAFFTSNDNQEVTAIRMFLNLKGIKYKEYNISESEIAQKLYTKNQITHIPTVVVFGEDNVILNTIVGYNKLELVKLANNL